MAEGRRAIRKLRLLLLNSGPWSFSQEFENRPKTFGLLSQICKFCPEESSKDSRQGQGGGVEANTPLVSAGFCRLSSHGYEYERLESGRTVALEFR